MGVQGALIGAVGAYAGVIVLERAGVLIAELIQSIPPFNRPYGAAGAMVTIVPLGGAVAGYYLTR